MVLIIGKCRVFLYIWFLILGKRGNVFVDDGRMFMLYVNIVVLVVF